MTDTLHGRAGRPVLVESGADLSFIDQLLPHRVVAPYKMRSQARDWCAENAGTRLFAADPRRFVVYWRYYSKSFRLCDGHYSYTLNSGQADWEMYRMRSRSGHMAVIFAFRDEMTAVMFKLAVG